MQKIKYLFFIVLVFFSSSNFYAKDPHPTKQEIWNSLSNDVDHWTDGLGHPIDKEIKEIVIALNAMGIKTTASCEGHLNWGELYPWVDLEVSSPEIEKLWEEIKLIQEQIEIIKANPNFSWIDLSEDEKELFNENFMLFQSMHIAKINLLEPLNKLLNQFYENRKISYDRILVIQHIYLGRLHSVGVERQVVRSESEQKSKLKEYREEMNAFAAFLKKKFMNSN